jgi:hypothetical protein
MAWRLEITRPGRMAHYQTHETHDSATREIMDHIMSYGPCTVRMVVDVERENAEDDLTFTLSPSSQTEVRKTMMLTKI